MQCDLFRLRKLSSSMQVLSSWDAVHSVLNFMSWP